MIEMPGEEYGVFNADYEALTKTADGLTEILGFFERQIALLDSLDDVSANYIATTAETLHKSPSQIINDMVRERIATPV